VRQTARGVRLASLGALALAATLGCSARGTDCERLTVRAPAWSLAGRALDLEIVTSGALAERDVSLVVAVGSKMVTRASTDEGRVRVVVPADRLAAGRQSISVKTGSESCQFEVRIVPRGRALAAALALVVVVAGGSFALRRRAAVSR